MSKRIFKLHCVVCSGYAPADESHDWICFSYFSPKTGEIKTVAIDEIKYNRIIRQLKDEMLELQFKLTLGLFTQKLFEEGKENGTFIFTV